MLRPALIELSNVSFGYGSRVVIKELSLKIKEGEFLFIVGANGSGKSSLIRGLLGTLLPLGGQIQRHQSTKLIGAVGFVPQRFVATANMPIDVSEFILLGTVGTTLSNINLKDRLSEILVRMELGDLSQLRSSNPVAILAIRYWVESAAVEFHASLEPQVNCRLHSLVRVMPKQIPGFRQCAGRAEACSGRPSGESQVLIPSRSKTSS